MFLMPLPDKLLGMSGGFPMRLGLYPVKRKGEKRGWNAIGCILTLRRASVGSPS